MIVGLLASLERDYPSNALSSALTGHIAGVPVRLCYATTPDRLTACALMHGHAAAHNSRHDGTGARWD